MPAIHRAAAALRATVALAVIGALLAACITAVGGSTRVGSPPYARGSGSAASEHRTLAAFHAVEVEAGVQVVIHTGATDEGTVTFDDNLVGRVHTVVEGGTLRIGIDGGIETRLTPRVEITASGSLDRIAADSAGSVEAAGLDVDAIEVRATSAGSIRLSGHAARLHLTVDTAGAAELGDLVVGDATVTLQTASRATVHAEDSISGSCTLASTLGLVGAPRSQTVMTDATSSVRAQ